MIWNIGIVGFGHVGQGFARVLMEKREYLRRKYDFRYKIVGIVDRSKGSIYRENGLPLKRVIKEVEEKGEFVSYLQRMSVEDLIKSGNLDILVEAIPTDVRTGEPSMRYLRIALENGVHAVTTNKGSIARGYRELKKIADRNGVLLKFEGTVLSGTPSINLMRDALAGCEITQIEGILNGTTNFILSMMERGLSFEEALHFAQEKGYAEKDPSGDVDGMDAAIKAVILANVIMDANISLEDVSVEGICKISSQDIKEALQQGNKIKLIATLIKKGDEVAVNVRPEKISRDNLLYSVDGIENALLIHTDNLGRVFIRGLGAGGKETGQAVLSDVLAIHNHYFSRDLEPRIQAALFPIFSEQFHLLHGTQNSFS